MGKVQETNAGLQFEGDWKEMCEYSKELEKAMDEYIEDQNEIDDFDDWRPHLEDDKGDMIEKTAEEASINEEKVEEDFEGSKKTIEEAEEKLIESTEEISHGEDPSQEIKEGLHDLEKIFEVESVRSVKKIEKTIYKQLMLRFNPLYFDKEDFSINLDKKDDEKYILKINISDDGLREHFQESFQK